MKKVRIILVAVILMMGLQVSPVGAATKYYTSKDIPDVQKEVFKKGTTIWDRGYVKGAKKRGTTTSYLYQSLKITRETKNKSGTYWKVYKGKKYLGWVNKNALGAVETIKYKKVAKPYKQIVTASNSTIWSKPYVKGAKKSANSKQFLNKEVTIKQEATTKYGTYKKIYQSNGKLIGWLYANGAKTKVVNGKTVYIAPNSGKKYHFDKNCRGLKAAKSIKTMKLPEAQKAGYTLCRFED
ncbi:hypothetical protein RU97_GL000953 [Enterococcus canis]|uniref:GW domain-containing protein n=1 Tax=Enterococcus canis TaxID=214095 RepID=A0A1L8RI56_9ENTE|nr:GW dipeptide domain-containing protein [Enterococcus canis]OJG19382.1 hypothetical protein RU97_GL000953 [Enterococcus canis]